MAIVGKIELRDGRWYVTAEPHVMQRLKRWFQKIDERNVGTARLSDTPENATDLLLFTSRYTFTISPEDHRHLEARAGDHREQVTLVERILAGKYTPPQCELAKPAREYQRVAAGLLLATGAIILGDDLGTGKTVSAIAALTDPRALPAVVVTLTALPGQWQEMIRTFAPSLRTHILRKAQPYDLSKGGRPDVIITSYSKIHGWAETLCALGVRSLILDEGHELRHAGTAKYESVKHLREHVNYCMAATATPVFGMGSQIYWLASIVRPGCLGTWEEFKREWCMADAGDKPRVKDTDLLGQHLRREGILLRRTRKDVGHELPALQNLAQHVDSNPRAFDRVESRASELARIVLAANVSGEAKRNAAGELDWRLRQATGIGKSPAAAEFIRMLLESGEKVLAFAWHREVYEVLLERLEDWRPAMYTGSETVREKDEAKRRFCDTDGRDHTNLLLMSLRSGAGLDGLQFSGCHVVVFVELDWAWAVHEQATGRLHRDGQSEPVIAYYLLSDSGSDPVIAEVLGVKRAQLVGIRDPGQPTAVPAQDESVIRERIRRLAEAHLARHGRPVHEAPAPHMKVASA